MKQRGRLIEGKKELDKDNLKSMANSLRVQILTILNERENSTTRMAKELGVDFSKVSYEVEALRKLGRIEIVDEVKVRGAVEVFYKAKARAILDDLEWPVVPDSVKGGLRASLLQTLVDDALFAIAEETYDSLDGAHMSWSPLVVDTKGWKELVAVLKRALEEVLAIHEQSAERLIANDEKGISCTVSILGYVSALEEQRVGKPVQMKDIKTSAKHRRSQKEGAAKKKGKRK